MSLGKRSSSRAAHLLDRVVVYEHNDRDKWNGCGAIAWCQSALFIGWYTGGWREPLPMNRVVWSRSRDNGQSWSAPAVIADPPGAPRACDPMLWRDPRDILHFTYGINDMTVQTDAGAGPYPTTKDWQFLHRTCDDPAADLVTWSQAERMAPDFDYFFNNKPIVLRNGEWLVPIAVRTRPGKGQPFHEGFCAAGALISGDGGNTWSGHRSPELEKSGYGPQDVAVWEAGAFQRDDGTVVIFVRNSWGVIQATESVDNGRTWSEFEPTAIPNPSSRFHVRKLPGGPVICLNNPSAVFDPQSRRYLSMHVSYDDGRAFSRLIVLDVEGRTMYPDADLDGDGHTLHIMYENRKDIFYASLDLREVL